jgi:hypothetical protein
LPVVIEFATSSTMERHASTNLLKAGDVQLGINAWWSALMWASLLKLDEPSGPNGFETLPCPPVMYEGNE